VLIEIINWEKYNPRKDVQHPTWFRLENTFWMDQALFSLDSDGKLVWVVLLSLASQKLSGTILVEISFIATVLRIPAQKVLDTIEHLNSKELLRKVSSHPRDADVTDTSRARIATDGRTDGRTDTDDGLFTPTEFLDAWNANRGPLAEVKRLTKSRADKIRARRKEEPDLAYWVGLIKRLAASDFATGKVRNDLYPTGWKADLTWLIKNDENHTKVAEGRYDNRGPAKPEVKIWSGDDNDLV
jgi:hypothetical protein